MEKDIYETMQNDVMNSDASEEDKQKMLKNIAKLKDQKVNVMIAGATGAGKSSTINALFNTEKAKVGVDVEPETMEIEKYELENLILWDTPGLGDGKKDSLHAKKISDLLYQKDENGNALIDLVLVILDGGSKDLGTSCELINQVIIPNLGEDKEKRILVAINQCDMAMKARGWDHESNKPKPELEKFLEKKVKDVQKRIEEGTGVKITPIYYSAGYKEEGREQRPYNLSKLLYFIVQHTPKQKRLAYVDNISKNEEMWKDDDRLIDYTNEVKKSFMETVVEYGSKGADIGEEIGSIFGEKGRTIGKIAGGVIGGGIGAAKSLCSWVGSWFD